MASPLSLPTGLVSPRLCVRVVQEADLADLLKFNAVDAVTQFLPYTSWTSLQQAQDWYSRMQAMADLGAGQQYVIVDKKTQCCIGSCLLMRFDAASARAELGYVLSQDYWRQGLMREAVSTLIEQAFSVWGLARLEAEVNPRNTPSVHLLERLGFRREGLLRQRWLAKGQRYDTAIYGLLADEWLNP